MQPGGCTRASETSLSSTAGQLSSVASSLLGSLTNFGSSNLVNLTTQSTNTLNPDFCDYALKYVNGSKDDQYIFSATLDIKEEEPKSQTFQLGRNVRNKDMQLLDLVSMGKSAGSSSSYKSTGYVVTAKWQQSKTNSALQVLNEETQKNARVFMTRGGKPVEKLKNLI
ncbi:rab GTPase-activating 1 [Brachionus plicatilis]|uniref:Rab GTPase-activating 1 n=1 Tax=Brachionus plicatilis TaxID=10195 RepID=A0A3M7QNZ9_BRAPC|nr:rab GTPase-activating 1 [Brachionus plicatilis]